MRRGRLFLLISAVLYGILPALSAAAYRGGLNGITLTFLRSAISLPVLYAIIRADGRPIRLSNIRLKQVIILGLLGGAMPILLLYISYQYISTGLAAALHFVYPVIIVISTSLLYHRRPPRIILAAVMIVTAGIFMFANIGGGTSAAGVTLALLSGAFYSFYVVYITRSGLDRFDFVVITFYVTLVMSISVLIFGAASGKLHFNITPLSWSLSAVISLTATLGAMPMFQLGVRYAGADEAGIYSTLEPVTTIALGALALGEFVDTPQLMGAGMIIFGVLLVRKYG